MPSWRVSPSPPPQPAQTTILTEDFEAPVVTGDDAYPPTPTGWVSTNQGCGSNQSGLINEDVDGPTGFEDPAGAQDHAFRYTNSGLTTAEGVIGTLQLGVTYTVSMDVVQDISGATPYLKMRELS